MNYTRLFNEMNRDELAQYISAHSPQPDAALISSAAALRDEIYGKRVFVRGLVEFSNFCARSCLYCGISCLNANIERYRLTPEQILVAVRHGYSLGMRSFVLQSGEDNYYTDEIMVDLIRSIKSACPGSSLTLSMGEKSGGTYLAYKAAGADRYLLRHESADPEHFNMLHTDDPGGANRKSCLAALKKAGFQVGAGFMVGSPFQTSLSLAADIIFLRELQPEMVGIGPFIPQKHTPLGAHPPGTAGQTLLMVAMVRHLLPYAMLPATTALGTLVNAGRESALAAGANVVMPNLTPPDLRANYAIYDNKLKTGAESAEGLDALNKAITGIGLQPDYTRGDAIKPKL